ncbi:MAG: DUF167 family protein [Gammaproteobacteria bacterium]|nr:DUF167 family protein [Gammaproteobacteria bacterium]
MSAPWLRRDGEALVLELHVQPGAQSTAVAGVHGGRLKIRVAAPPVEGAANKALQRFLARAFGVSGHDVDIVRGIAGRRKQVLIRGAGVLPPWAVAED